MQAAFSKEGQRPQTGESLGLLVSKQGQEKNSGDIQRHPDVVVRVSDRVCVFVFLFQEKNKEKI